MDLKTFINNALTEGEVEIFVKTIERNCNYHKLRVVDESNECFCIQDFNKYDISEGIVIISKISRNVTTKGTFYNLVSYRPSEKQITSFLPKTEIDINAYWNWMLSEAAKLRPSLRWIVSNVLAKYQTAICQNYLNELSFNRMGGIVEATVNLIAQVRSFASLEAYRGRIDAEMLIASALIYYIDSVKVMDLYKTSIPGQLFCANQIAYNLVTEVIAEIKAGPNQQAIVDLNDQDTCLLLHNISSKYYEYQACTLEAVLLRQTDGLLKEMDLVCNQSAGKKGMLNLTDSYTKKLYIP